MLSCSPLPISGANTSCWLFDNLIAAASDKKKKGGGRVKPQQRVVTMTKRDYKDALKTHKDEHPGHLYFQTPKNCDSMAEDAEVRLTEVYSCELGHCAGVCNTFFKKAQESRTGGSGNNVDKHGWCSVVAAGINSKRKAMQEIHMTSLNNREEPLVTTDVMDSFDNIMTDFKSDLFSGVGESCEV